MQLVPCPSSHFPFPKANQLFGTCCTCMMVHTVGESWYASLPVNRVLLLVYCAVALSIIVLLLGPSAVPSSASAHHVAPAPAPVCVPR
jgi:hypothetical protein